MGDRGFANKNRETLVRRPSPFAHLPNHLQSSPKDGGHEAVDIENRMRGLPMGYASPGAMLDDAQRVRLWGDLYMWQGVCMV